MYRKEKETKFEREGVSEKDRKERNTYYVYK